MWDTTFLQERIDATKAQIVAYEDAVVALLNDTIQSFSINTGQTSESVTKRDVDKLEATISSLYNRLATLEARRNGSGITQGVPGW
jgi:hypothetical protein